MNVDGIKHAADWPFEVPEFLAVSIEELIEAMRTDDINMDCYMYEVITNARGVSEEHDAILRHYYVEGGWREESTAESD